MAYFSLKTVALAFLLFQIRNTTYAQVPDTALKWYISNEKAPENTFNVTIDASKEGRYLQFGKLRFSIDYKDSGNRILKRDTLDYFSNVSEEKDPYNALGIVSGGTVLTRAFKNPYGPGSTVNGGRLFYQWHDTSYNTAPDPVEDKVIIEEYIFGDASSAVSIPPVK